MKTLHIKIRGEVYKIDCHGCFFGGPNNVTQGCKDGHEWRFIGVSTHHWHNHVVHNLKSILDNPKLAVGGYLWDVDHGTTRIWGGRYCGHLPRITTAYLD